MEFCKLNQTRKPSTLQEWQIMFASIYPIQEGQRLEYILLKIMEKVGELTASMNSFTVSPTRFLSCIADLFELLILARGVVALWEGFKLDEADTKLKCHQCEEPICLCPEPEVESSLPLKETAFPGKLPVIMRANPESVSIGNSTFEVGDEMIWDIHQMVTQILFAVKQNGLLQEALDLQLANVLNSIRELTLAHRISQDTIDDLAQRIAGLPSEARSVALGFLTNVAAGPWVAALLNLVDHLAKIIH